MTTLAKLSDSNSHSMEWPIDLGITDPNSLERQLAEQQLVIEAQANMLNTLTATPSDDATMKTIAVFQENAKKDRELLQIVTKKNEQLEVQLIQTQAALAEAKKTNEVEKQEMKKLFDEMRAQNASLNTKVLSQEQAIDDLTNKFAALEKRFNGHRHLDGYTNRIHYTGGPC